MGAVRTVTGRAASPRTRRRSPGWEENTQRSRQRRSSSANHHSTCLIHDEYVGVKCSSNRGGRQQPLGDDRRLVGGEVAADHVDRQAGLGLAVDLVEEVTGVDSPVLCGQLPDDLAGGGVQGGEQVHCAMPE